MHARRGLLLLLAAAHGFVHTANHRHSSALLGWRYSIEECDVDGGDECGAGQLDVRQLGYNSGLGAWVYERRKPKSKVTLPVDQPQSTRVTEMVIEECDSNEEECDVGEFDVRSLGYQSGVGSWIFEAAAKRRAKKRAAEEVPTVKAEVVDEATQPVGWAARLKGRPKPIVVSAMHQGGVWMTDSFMKDLAEPLDAEPLAEYLDDEDVRADAPMHEEPAYQRSR